MPASVSRIFQTKYWSSPTQHTFNDSVMTWLWVKHRHTTDQTMGHSASWWSKLTSPRTLLCCETRRCLKLVLNTASCGFTTLPVSRLGLVNDVCLYCIDFTSVEVVHMTDPDDWFHIPICPVSPALAETRYTDFACKGVIFNQSGTGSPFLKHAFAQRHILTDKELELVCGHLMLDPLPTTRESCIRSLCAKLCDGSSEEATRKYTDNALANLLVTKKKKNGHSKLLTSPLNVQCFSELPEDDQEDLKDVGEAQKFFKKGTMQLGDSGTRLCETEPTHMRRPKLKLVPKLKLLPSPNWALSHAMSVAACRLQSSYLYCTSYLLQLCRSPDLDKAPMQSAKTANRSSAYYDKPN